MWHDAWPPLPPGGHRPPDAPPFTSPGDQLLAVGLGATAGAGALVWATGQAAGLAFGHTWLELSPADVAHVLWHLPQHWSDPALAWPADVRGPLPGPAGMYATFTGLVGGLSGGTAAVLRHLPGRAAGHRPGHPQAGQACRRGLGQRSGAAAADRGRARAGPGDPGPHPRRLRAGCWRPRTATRSWSSAPPAATRPRPWSSPPSWNGPAPWSPPASSRTCCAPPWPTGPGWARCWSSTPWAPPASRPPAGRPLASCSTWAGAQQTAVQLANAIEQTPTEEQRPEHRFWKTMGTKFLAPMLYRRRHQGPGHGRGPALARQPRGPGGQGHPGGGRGAGRDRCLGVQPVPHRPGRGLAVCHGRGGPGRLRQPARLRLHRRPRPGPGRTSCAGDNTIYLYAPAHQQRLLRPLFETITQQVVAAAQEQAALAPDGMLSPAAGAVPGRGRQLRRPVRPGRAGHHRPGPGHPAGHRLA